MYRAAIKHNILTLSLAVILISTGSLLMGQIPDLSRIDFRSIKVTELTDNQIKQLIDQAKTRGLSEQDLTAEAISRGMPYSEVLKLRERIASIRSGEAEPVAETFPQARVAPDLVVPDWTLPSDTGGIKVFGYNMFRRENLSFEPSFNIPTPSNYVLGAGDNLIIEVWGASQQTYELPVTPEGAISITNIGPVRVSGLTVEQASQLIINRLSSIYSGLKGSNPNTFAQVSLAGARSIKISITGDAYLPGTYTLPAFATAFNALYLAGGPAENGSFREIRVIRNGDVVSIMDLYDFLLKGETKLNIRLQDEDMIFIGPYQKQVMVTGEVKRPAIYEILENETLGNLIAFSGGFTADAFRKRLQVDRKTDSQRTLLNVESTLFSSFLLSDGDSIPVEGILDRYENRVTINGAVWREGSFELTDGMTLSTLISRAEGLREDAFMNRAAIYRLQEDLQLKVIEVNLRDVINGKGQDIVLHREDLVLVSSLSDLEQEQTVRVVGEVQKPGTYPWARYQTLGELIRIAGGLKESASLSRVEVARRVTDRKALKVGDQVTHIFNFPLDAGLSLNDTAASFVLEPFDMAFVRRSPGYEEQVLAEVRGEINFPGNYAISKRSERISDLVTRSGGITNDAYLPGATLYREVDTTQIANLDRMAVIDTSQAILDIEEIAKVTTQAIGIDLRKILNNPYSSDDLILEEGDVLFIPRELQTVRLNGGLLYPVTVRYQDRMGLKRYVSQAGGFTSNASRSKVFVVYANGSVDQTRSFMGIKSYPPVKPGAEIFVPLKPEKETKSVQETLAVSSALTSIALVIVSIVRLF